MPEITFETASAAETERVGAALARALTAGDVVTVEGELGAGKTTLVRGACAALGVGEPVTSPTFVIGRTYYGRVRVAHVDLYRLGSLSLEDPALLADYFGPNTVTFVEWPQAEAEMISAGEIVAGVRMAHRGDDRRQLRVSGAERALDALRGVAEPG